MNRPLSVRIFQPAKTTMQSGRGKTHYWLIEPELLSPRTPEPLMGWTQASDTLMQLLYRLRFDTEAQAIAFAQSKGWNYTLIQPQQRRTQPRNYLDNFRYQPTAAALGRGDGQSKDSQSKDG